MITVIAYLTGWRPGPLLAHPVAALVAADEAAEEEEQDEEDDGEQHAGDDPDLLREGVVHRQHHLLHVELQTAIHSGFIIVINVGPYFR